MVNVLIISVNDLKANYDNNSLSKCWHNLFPIPVCDLRLFILGGHTYTHTHTHAHMHTYTIHTHAHMHTHMHTQTHAYMHTRTCTQTQPRTLNATNPYPFKPHLHCKQGSVHPFKPYSALLVTSYCALRRKDSLYALCARFYLSRKGGTGGGGCGHPQGTWWLLGLAVKAPWSGPVGPILALAAWTGLENATLTLGSERVYDN